jgi:hypothetical protein
MNAIQEAITLLLRGPRASRFLRSLGIDARRYWLLMDLFGELSERGEMLDQLGRNEVALKVMTWLYAAYSALISVFLVIAQTAPATYLSIFLVFTAFLVLFILLSETGNSLVNPAEGLVLAHQPVNGATYTAAKLTHLARIVLYLVLGINAVPAFAALMLKRSGWSYPLVHLLAALVIGFVGALLCCALYGWLIRLVPAKRLKATAQLASTLPMLAMIWWQPMKRLVERSNFLRLLPEQPTGRWALGLAVGAVAAAVVALGIRSLSADYLIRISSIMHGGSATASHRRKSRIGEIVARLFGGQPARAGYAFVSRMARRDFQFRRQVVPMLIFALIGLATSVALDWRSDPFSARFTAVHLLPHILGLMLFFICILLPYGNDFKGAWAFLLAPAQVFGRFARGVYAALWIQMIVIPHAIMLLLFAWSWGMWHAGLFIAYSLAVSSIYLGLELRLIDGAPFCKQVDPARSATMMLVMILGGMAMAVAVGVQYFFVFRSPAIVATVTMGAGAAAYLLTRSSLVALADSIRYSLGLLSAESGTLYKEINI